MGGFKMKKIIATMAVGLMALGSYANAGTTVCLITKIPTGPLLDVWMSDNRSKAYVQP